MSFVTDAHDPSGLGMFSKVGRFTSEKYIIFQKKDEILYNKRKFLKVSNLPNLDSVLIEACLFILKFWKKIKTEEENDIEFEKKEDLLEIVPPEKETKKTKAIEQKKPEEKHRKEESQPFYKMLSRGKVDSRLVKIE